MEKVEKMDLEVLKAELKDLGINNYLIKQKSGKNLYMAKKIVESYDFGRELTKREKRALIQTVLDRRALNTERTQYLSVLIQRLGEAGIEGQDVYGLIINSAIHEHIVDEKGYGYGDLLFNKNNVCQTIGEKIKPEDTKVQSMSILKALSHNINEEEEKALIQELEAMGVNGNIIKQTEIYNVFIAKTIVERYEFEKELSPEEKGAMIQCFISTAATSKQARKQIVELMLTLQKNGFEEQEIYGLMINLAVRGEILENKEKKYTYNKLVFDNTLCEEIVEQRDKIDTKVTPMVILSAQSQCVSEEQEQKIKEEALTWGVNQYFMNRKERSNLYTAKWIVDNFDMGREMVKGEKRAIFQSILGSAKLDSVNPAYIHKLMLKLEKMGFDEEEVSGAIINFATNIIELDRDYYSYSALLSNKDGILVNLDKYAGQIETIVRMSTMAYIIQRSEKIMKKAAKKQKAKGNIKKQSNIRAELDSLVRQEMAQENVEEQEQYQN